MNFSSNNPGGSSAFVRKRLQHSCSFINTSKFLTTPISKNFCEQLLLKILMFFIKHSELISFFYKNKNEKKRNSIEIMQNYIGRKSCNKIK